MPKPSDTYNLYVLMPELARQWHPTKNGALGPKDVTPGSNRRVWWLCEKGHWWLARVRDRTRGMQCTFCRDLGKQSDQKMAEVKPELIREWHPSRNAGISAREVTLLHKDKVWWICGQGHEWEATVRSRLTGRACPVCIPTGYRTEARSFKIPEAGFRPGAAENPGSAAPPPRLAAWREPAAALHNGAELRKSARYERSAVVMIEKPRAGIVGYAQLHNFSAGGMMLYSDFAFKPGELISVRTEQPLYPSAPNVVASQVVWCRDAESQGEGNGRFGVGLRRI